MHGIYVIFYLSSRNAPFEDVKAKLLSPEMFCDISFWICIEDCQSGGSQQDVGCSLCVGFKTSTALEQI